MTMVDFVDLRSLNSSSFLISLFVSCNSSPKPYGSRRIPLSVRSPPSCRHSSRWFLGKTPSSDLLLVSTAELSDGSVVFRFGTEAEDAESKMGMDEAGNDVVVEEDGVDGEMEKELGSGSMGRIAEEMNSARDQGIETGVIDLREEMELDDGVEGKKLSISRELGEVTREDVEAEEYGDEKLELGVVVSGINQGNWIVDLDEERSGRSVIAFQENLVEEQVLDLKREEGSGSVMKESNEIVREEESLEREESGHLVIESSEILQVEEDLETWDLERERSRESMLESREVFEEERSLERVNLEREQSIDSMGESREVFEEEKNLEGLDLEREQSTDPIPEPREVLEKETTLESLDLERGQGTGSMLAPRGDLQEEKSKKCLELEREQSSSSVVESSVIIREDQSLESLDMATEMVSGSVLETREILQEEKSLQLHHLEKDETPREEEISECLDSGNEQGNSLVMDLSETLIEEKSSGFLDMERKEISTLAMESSGNQQLENKENDLEDEQIDGLVSELSIDNEASVKVKSNEVIEGVDDKEAGVVDDEMLVLPSQIQDINEGLEIITPRHSNTAQDVEMSHASINSLKEPALQLQEECTGRDENNIGNVEVASPLTEMPGFESVVNYNGETVTSTRRLFLSSGAVMLPHPSKVGKMLILWHVRTGSE